MNDSITKVSIANTPPKIVKSVLTIACFLGMFAASAASGATVNSTADPGDGTCNATECTLREAIAAAASGETIDFSVTGTITLTALLDIDKSLTITGPTGAGGGIELSGNDLVQVLRILGGAYDVTLSGLTIANGRSGLTSETTGTLTITSCTFTDNQVVTSDDAARGGAIRHSGTGAINITGSTFSSNVATTAGFTAEGGAIHNGTAAITIASSVFSQNSAASEQGDAGGGAIVNAEGALTISGSEFSQNSATGAANALGGAILNGSGAVSISAESVLTGNSAVGRGTASGSSGRSAGGAIYSNSGGMTVTSSTLTGNRAGVDFSAGGAVAGIQARGGAIYVGSDAVTITSSRISQNTASAESALGGGLGTGGVTLRVVSTEMSENSALSPLGGFSFTFSGGGAISAVSGTTAEIEESRFERNSVVSSAFIATGGAISIEGGATSSAASDTSAVVAEPAAALSIARSVITGNSVLGIIAIGGGVASGADLSRTVTETTFSGNRIDGFFTAGGGLALTGPGPATVTDSTFSGGTVKGNPFEGAGQALGGGISTESPLIVRNSTFSGNTVNGGEGGSGRGGGMFSGAVLGSFFGGSTGTAALTVENSTVANNTATAEGEGSSSEGGGIYNEPPPAASPSPSPTPSVVTVGNTIIAKNTASVGPDVRNEFVSQGYNLIGNGDDSSGFGAPASGDQVGTTAAPIDPKLGELGNYGGPTFTLPLLSDSPALNAGDPNFDATTLPADQRGFPRVRHGRLDIGAYEAPPPITITGPAEGSRTGSTPTITGTAEPGSTVVLNITNGSTTVTVTTTADSSGKFTVATPALGEGSYTVSGAGGFSLTEIAVAPFPRENRNFIVDATPPVFSGVPADMTVEATGPDGAVVTYTKPAATDNFDGPREVTCAPASGSTFAIATTMVTCSASDTVGNTATARFNVTVRDTTPPTITAPGEIVVYNQLGKNGANVSFQVSATDIVDGSVTPTASPASGSLFPIGTTTITVTATDSRGNSGTRTFNVTVRETEMANISTRVPVGEGDNNAGIGGFIVRGSGLRQVVIRAMGPSVTINGTPIAGALQDPMVELYRSGEEQPIATNDNWQSSQESAIAGTTLAPNDPRESAILVDLPAGNYTAVVRGAGGSTGIALVEVYALLTAANAELGNISTRGQVLTGDDVLIGGVIVRGGDPERLLFRAIGPKLADRGVENALQDPTLELRDGNGELIERNDNWRDDHEDEIEDTNMAPDDDRESAIVATLVGGNYTAVVRGRDNTTGIGLVEVFSLADDLAAK